MDAPPIVCTLSEEELGQRRAGLLGQVRERVLAVRRWSAAEALAPADAAATDAAGPAMARNEGFELLFARDDATVADLLELVRLESRCCAFLSFRLTVEPAGGALRLEISGPPGTAELLAGELAPAGGTESS
jgi:hypothetical protein